MPRATGPRADRAPHRSRTRSRSRPRGRVCGSGPGYQVRGSAPRRCRADERLPPPRLQALGLPALGEREPEPFARIGLAYDPRTLLKPRPYRGTQPSLACDELVAARHAPHDERLQETVAANGVREGRKRLLVELPPRL